MEKRCLSLDALRIFAIFFVIYTHIGYNCKTMFAPTDSPILYTLSVFWGLFCRVAVPIFFMISGALLLQKNENYKTIFKKRLLRFAIVLFIISAVTYFTQWKNHSVLGFASALYSYTAAPSLWYLYSYIELLLLLPFLRKLAQSMTKKDYLYYFILQFVFVTVFPTFEAVTGLSSINILIVLTTNNIFYFMMGHFFVNVAEDSFYCKKNLLIFNIAGLSFLIFGFAYLFFVHTQNGIVTADDESLFAFISVPTFAVFFDFKYIFDRIAVKEKSAKIVQEIGTASFGVYLIQGIFITQTQPIADFLSIYLSPVISGLLYSLIVLLSCTLIIFPLRKLPLLNKLI